MYCPKKRLVRVTCAILTSCFFLPTIPRSPSGVFGRVESSARKKREHDLIRSPEAILDLCEKEQAIL